MEAQYVIALLQNQLNCPSLFILHNLLVAFIISIEIAPRDTSKKWELC